MRYTKNYILLTAWLAAFCLVLPGTGQQRITAANVSVPFDFWIGNKKFPAGDYTLDSGVPTFVTVRNKNGSVNEQVPTLLFGEGVSKKDAKLLFVSRNGKYYLKELWGVLGKRTITPEYGRNVPQDNTGAREIALTYP